MPEPTNIVNDSTEAQVHGINLEIAVAELEKLKLEIRDLQPKSKWSQRIARLIPIITATISIAGFLWGVNTFSQQQERDRQTREADQISRDKALYRSSYEQLLQFSSNPNMTVARVLFLRQDLNNLINSIYPPDKKLEDNQREKRELANSIFQLIHKDCDFTQARQVQFDMAALRDSIGREKGPEGYQNSVVIHKYLQTLRDLEFKQPGELMKIRQVDSTEFQDPGALLKDPYRSLIDGFGCHLSVLPADERARAINNFTYITKNPILTAGLFNSETPPKCP